MTGKTHLGYVVLGGSNTDCGLVTNLEINPEDPPNYNYLWAPFFLRVPQTIS